ncbi:MAG: hypothetical protein ACM3JG_16440 [Thiohalocapsa sp.]
MQIIHPAPHQAAAIVQAMHAVVTAEGSIAALPIECETIAAIERHLLHLEAPPPPPAPTLPADLAGSLDDPVLRTETIRILALLPAIDQQVRPEKIAVVERAATALGVNDRGLVILRQAARRQLRRIALGMMRRSVAHYWSPTGKARLRDWLDMLRIFMPKIPGLYQLLTDRTLLARYRALAARPEATLGHQLYRFYQKRGYPMPGEPNSFPEGWSKHEAYHIISGYETSLQGEMLNAAFSGGNTEILCMDLLLLTLLQFQAGLQIMPGPAPRGELRPDAFFRAVARGMAMQVDLLEGWDLWSAVDLPLGELRRRYGVPPLSEEERLALQQCDALIS